MKRGVSVGESGVGNDLLYPSLDVASFPDAARTSDDEDRIRNEVSWRYLMKLKGDLLCHNNCGDVQAMEVSK